MPESAINSEMVIKISNIPYVPKSEGVNILDRKTVARKLRPNLPKELIAFQNKPDFTLIWLLI